MKEGEKMVVRMQRKRVSVRLRRWSPLWIVFRTVAILGGIAAAIGCGMSFAVLLHILIRW